MTILWLDEDPEIAASYHCDVHVEKKCLEYAEVLSTAAYLAGFHDPTRMTKPDEEKYGEVAEWVAESSTNFFRTMMLAKALSKEHLARFGVSHIASEKVIFKMNISEVRIPDKGFTEPPAEVPEYCDKEDFVDSYRAYYNYGVGRSLSWFNGNVPTWYNGSVAGTSGGKTA